MATHQLVQPRRILAALTKTPHLDVMFNLCQNKFRLVQHNWTISICTHATRIADLSKVGAPQGILLILIFQSHTYCETDYDDYRYLVFQSGYPRRSVIILNILILFKFQSRLGDYNKNNQMIGKREDSLSLSRRRTSPKTGEQLKKPPIWKNRNPMKLGQLAILLAVASLIPRVVVGSVSSCDAGYYLQSNKCEPCTAGYECTGNNSRTTCNGSLGKWSLKGYSACQDCPDGHSCSSTSAFPVACAQGEKVVSYACQSCTGTEICPDPAISLTTCTTDQITTDQKWCEPCPAGKTCSGSSSISSSCSTGKYSLLGENSCTQAVAGQFAPSTTMALQSCPTNMFSFSNQETTCEVCPAGQLCNSPSSKSSCTFPEQGDVGDPECSEIYDYFVDTSSTTTRLEQEACRTDEVKSGSTSCIDCPVKYACSYFDQLSSSKTSCASTEYSDAGSMYCRNVAFGVNYDTSSGATTTCNTGTHYFDAAANECKPLSDCPSDKICDPTTGEETTCQAGYYMKTNGDNTKSCEDCPVKKTCDGSATKSTITNGYISKGNYATPVQIFPGYKSTNKNSHAACATGEFSIQGDHECSSDTDTDFLYQSDIGGATCPSQGKMTTDRLRCDMSALDYTTTLRDTTEACDIKDDGAAWFGEQCATCTLANTYPNKGTRCRAMEKYHDLTCTPGESQNDGACSTQDAYGFDEAANGIRVQCPSGHSTGSSPDAEGNQCQMCPDLYSCAAKCYDKNFSHDQIDAVYFFQLHDRRMQNYVGGECIDCNDANHRDALCTFETNYFTNDPGHMLTCPFQTDSRTQVRYDFPNTHSASHEWYTLNNLSPARGSSFEAERKTTRDHNSAVETEYESKVWFLRDDDDRQDDANTFHYPYCKTEYIYFDYQQMDDHNSTYTASNEGDCTIYEHLQTNYKNCVPNYPGFISGVNSDTATENPVNDDYVGSTDDKQYITVMEYDEMGQETSLQLDQCPQHTDVLKDNAGNLYLGGGSMQHACQLRRPGECVDSESNFCNSGGDFKCPSGTTFVDADQTANDCTACTSGNYCVDGATTTCPTGYQCPAYSYAEFGYPAQPGSKISSSTESSCDTANTYCPGATGTGTACPSGFKTEYNTGATNDNFSSLACQPIGAGPDSSGGSCVNAGTYCPETNTELECHPGTFKATNGGYRRSDCTACSAGKWCDQKSGTEGSCPDGSYCPERTIFSDEYGCDAGTTSSGGSNPSSQSQCTSCPVGEFCREGLTETNLCSDEGYVCPSGSATREYCDAGSYIANASSKPASSSACDSCNAGKHCPGYGGEKDCRNGYYSSSDAAQCSATDAGKFTSSDGAATQSDAASNKWALIGDIEERDCPRGEVCDGSAGKTSCPSGSYCAEGSAASPSSGMVQDEGGLWYAKPCPAGKVCAPGGSTVKASDGRWTIQGETADTSNSCADGYTCLNTDGSTGEYEDGCPYGEWTAADTTTGCSTASCEAGKNCGQGSKIDCPDGMYCLSGTPEYIECPAGTYLPTTTDGTQLADCKACDAGKACTGKSLIQVTGECGAGFYCSASATTTTPFDACTNYDSVNNRCDETPAGEEVVQSICPFGFYCGQGDTVPTRCADGQFSTGFGARDDGLCINCRPGFFCGSTSVAASDICTGGYVCPEATAAQINDGGANDNQAPTGSFTQTGYPVKVLCEPGTFQDSEGQASCDDCPEGKYCDTTGLSTAKDCLDGHDCDALATVYPDICKYGEYADTSDNGKCTACPQDKYCQANALFGDSTGTTGGTDCGNGYNCVTNTTHQYPNWTPTENPQSHLCDYGNYCDNSQATTVNQCPEGTYMPRLGAEVLGDCVECPAGYQCDTDGMTTPLICPADSYCAKGTGSSSHSVKPELCTLGEYCPIIARDDVDDRIPDNTVASSIYPNQQAMSNALKCPFGMYQDATTLASDATVCEDCPTAKKCSATGLTATETCDAGYYCPINSSRPLLCPEGKKTTTDQVDIDDCVNLTKNDYIKSVDNYNANGGQIMDGYESTAVGETWMIPVLAGQVCSYGSFCIGGDIDFCANGKYCPQYGLTAQGQDCDAGFYCLRGNWSPRPINEIEIDATATIGDRCPSGQFCIAGSNAGENCPVGTFSSGRGLTETDECSICPSGVECLTTGMLSTDLDDHPCETGYYCPKGVSTSTVSASYVAGERVKCENGKYCPGTLQNSFVGIPCAAGQYIVSSTFPKQTCIDCEAGSYCPYTFSESDLDSSSNSQLTDCPVGHQCDAAPLDAPVPCLPGFYMDTTQSTVETCKQCDAGNYCPQEGQETKIACPDFMYCPLGSAQPIECVDGQICRLQASLPAELQGYDDGDVTTPILIDDNQTKFTYCPKGFYCIKGKEAKCFAGYICNSGSSTPIPTDGSAGKICPYGYYCLEGAQPDPTQALAINQLAETPCPLNTYNDKLGIEAPEQCTNCITGQRCVTLALDYPITENCVLGYRCPISGTTVADKTPPGTYSPLGVTTWLICPEGTYQHQTETGDCNQCTKGFYCFQDTQVQSYPHGVEVEHGVKCPEGFYCEAGTAAPNSTPCPIGKYGKTDPDVGAETVGAGLESPEQCTDCPATFYCPEKGMKFSDTSAYKCKKGHICDAGSETEEGTSLCPIDNWCEDGIPNVCLAGTYSLTLGLTTQDECIDCPPGKYCPNNSVGMQDCPAGYFCDGGMHLPPTDASYTTTKQCTAGHYCPTGSMQEVKCPPGTFQDGVQATECKPCLAGTYQRESGQITCTSCATNSNEDNWYCPAGSVLPKKCTIGEQVSADATTCDQCTAGSFCWPCHKQVTSDSFYCFHDKTDSTDYTAGHNGLVASCKHEEGYVCRAGSYSPRPTKNGFSLIQPGSSDFSSYSGPTIRGHKSTASGTLEECQPGQWQPTFFGTSCIDCMKGRYCDEPAMEDLSNNRCNAGYECPTGQTEADAALNKCAEFKVCPSTLIHSIECQDGFYAPAGETGLSRCVTCEEDKYCNNVESTTPKDCNVGSVCELQTKRQPICEPGMYASTDETTGITICQNCDESYYCRAGIVADQCAAGYVCKEGVNALPNPSLGQCSVAHFCPKGARSETHCPFETMSVQTTQRQITDCRGCQPGYVCPWGDYDYYKCPKGHWCPIMGDKINYQSYENECPPGTYNFQELRVYENECKQCPEGYACDEYATQDLSDKLCPKGHWCPAGTSEPNKCPPATYYDEEGASQEVDCIECPAGNYCPEGSAEPLECSPGHYCLSSVPAQTTCPGGKYCNSEFNYQQKDCPINYYCERGSSEPAECLIEEKYICPTINTEVPIYCGPGFEVIDNRKYGSANSCRACRPGFFSGYSSTECEICPAGYVCLGETNTNRPTIRSNHNGIKCPKGSYCPEGSFEEINCPPGSFNGIEGKEKLEDCLLCSPGTFQDEYGKEGCKVCGQYADSNEGMDICECIGANRAYSAEDATCRCKSGFDYLDEKEQSEGNVSDLTDCFPLVFENCKHNSNNNSVRQPDGTCVAEDECAQACDGEPGLRSLVLGVCSCENALDVDVICNQDCRNNAPLTEFVSSTAISLSTADGKSQTVDLTEVGNAYGKLEKCRTESQDCEIKSVEIGGDGFNGVYGAASVIADLIARRRNLGHNVSDLLMEHVNHRRLQVSTNAKIFNPVYCIKEQDTFMFAIENSSHFPVYMKNSVMNSNDIFDYGAFQVLEEEMLRQKANKDETPSIFSFTFKQEGSYVFKDAANDQKILIIQVVGPGGQCSDTDRFVQTISEQSVGESGVSQSGSLILQPNYMLIAAMVGLLLAATTLIMGSIGFCLHKGWKTKELTEGTYRDYQLPLDIHHENEKIFYGKNDFINYKSDLIDSEEDDLDNFNLDIQFDLIDAGDKYLKMYNKRKMKHKNAKVSKREDVSRLLMDIENLIQQIGNSAMSSNMNWLDLDQQGDDVDDDKLREQIENELQVLDQREKEEDTAYAQKKQELLNDCSDYDKAQFDLALKKLNQGQNEFKKEMQSAALESVRTSIVTPEQAIYDNGDVNSRNNKYVAQIQNNDDLTSEEKERLLKNHDENLNQLGDLMAMDKKRQEQELDRILKERMERRRKLKEKQHAKEIKDEGKIAEAQVNTEFDKKQADFLEQNKAYQQEKTDEVLKNPDFAQQREGLKNLEKETEQLKKEGLQRLEDEKKAKIEAEKKAIRDRFTMGAKDEAEIRGELQALMQSDSRNYDSIMQKADANKKDQDDKLAERLRRRKELNAKKIQDKQAEIQLEFDDMDIEQVVEQEKAAEAAQEVIEQEKLAQEETASKATGGASASPFGGTGNNPLLSGLIGNAMSAVNGLLDKNASNFQEVAKKEEDKRKNDSRKQLNGIQDQIDIDLEKSRLLSQLADVDANLVASVEDDQAKQAEKQAARRALLLARRKNKKKHEIEEERVKDKIKVLEEEDEEKQKISEEYIRNLFAKKFGAPADTPQETEKKLQLLNEFLSDQFLERMSGLLMKQFTEKEQMLKLLLQKYSDQTLAETDSIKKQFKIDKDKLEEIKNQMPEQAYTDTLKNLRLNEENILREIDLKLQNAHKTEEATLRKEVEKKLAAEQVSFRTSMADQQSKLRRQLIQDSGLVDGEAVADKQSLEKYQRQKKQEQERRLRNIDLQKKTLQNTFENDLKNKYSDYDELLRRKREMQSGLDEDAANLRQRIEERQDKIKNSNKDEGMTAEQQEALLKNLNKQLASLDSAYSVEQQRQRLYMKQKLAIRKEKMEKARSLKEKLERQDAIQAAKDMKKKLGSIFKRQGTIKLHDANDNSELMRRLRSWKINQKKASETAYQVKLAQCEVDLEENETKIMILKLLQTEKMLKEVRRQVRKNGTTVRPSNQYARQSSRASGSQFGMKDRQDSSQSVQRLRFGKQQTSKDASKFGHRNSVKRNSDKRRASENVSEM